MSAVPTILLSLALFVVADFVRWRIVVGQELKRRELVRVGGAGLRITPASGFRLIEACTCERHGKEYRVVIMNRGWLRTQLTVEVVEL